MVGLVLAVTFVAFEALAVATILPVVGRHLGQLRLYGWVFSAFLLASLIGIVLAGTLADRVPLARLMLAGLGSFALGLVIGGTAPDMLVLVAGRAVQGLGAGVVPAVAYVAISRCYAEESRPRMFAVLSTAWVVPGMAGPAIAALVAAAAGWRWVFLGLLPLVLVAGGLVVLALRDVPPPASPATASVPYLAVLGVVAGAGIGTAYAPLSVTTLDRAAPGEEGRATSSLQLCDVLGQAVGTGGAGAILAAASRLGPGPGVALALAFAVAAAVAAVVVGARLPAQLTLAEATKSR
jgi:MFS family permease